MKLKKLVPACSLALATMFGASAQAQISGDTIKIGFDWRWERLTDRRWPRRICRYSPAAARSGDG